MTSLVSDCAESIEHLDDCVADAAECSVLSGVDCASVTLQCEQSRQRKEYFTALERSAVYAGCSELEATHAQFAAVEVQVRAPSRAAAEQVIAEHQAVVDAFNVPGGCEGRRSLRADHDRCGAELLAERRKTQQLRAALERKDHEIADLEAQLRHLRDQRSAIDPAADPAADPATDPAADHRREPRTAASHRSQRRFRRRQQQEQAGDGAALVLTHRADGAPTVCSASPCELFDGVCMHGGTCSALQENAREGAFVCQCAAGYGGARCEADVDECASAPCQNGGACIESGDLGSDSVPLDSFACACADGYVGTACEQSAPEPEPEPQADGDECDGLTDAQALLAWRAGLSAVPDGCPVAQWEGDDACGWEGVDCGDCVGSSRESNCRSYNADAEHPQRVTAVYTSGYNNSPCGGIVGTLSPCLARLEYLRLLSLWGIPGLSGPVPTEMVDGLPHLNSQLLLDGTAVDGPSCHRACDSHPQIGSGYCLCP
eukprot:SAG31_NODE_2171_length_6265_cov_3.765326_8_plen_489_part_00